MFLSLMNWIQSLTLKSMKTRSINDDGISSNRKTVFDDTLKDANSIDYGKYLNKNNKENKYEN